MASSKATEAARKGRQSIRAIIVNESGTAAKGAPRDPAASGLLRRERSDPPTLRLLRGEQSGKTKGRTRDGDTIDVSSGELEILGSPAAITATEETVVADWICMDRSFLLAFAGSCTMLMVAGLMVLVTGGVPDAQPVTREGQSITIASGSVASPPAMHTETKAPPAEPAEEAATDQVADAEMAAAPPSADRSSKRVTASRSSTKGKRVSLPRTRSSKASASKLRATKRSRAPARSFNAQASARKRSSHRVATR